MQEEDPRRQTNPRKATTLAQKTATGTAGEKFTTNSGKAAAPAQRRNIHAFQGDKADPPVAKLAKARAAPLLPVPHPTAAQQAGRTTSEKFKAEPAARSSMDVPEPVSKPEDAGYKGKYCAVCYVGGE